MSYLIIVYCLLFGWLAWRRAVWAVALIIFALPTYLIRFTVSGVPLTLLEAMILILFGIWLIKQWWRNVMVSVPNHDLGGYGWLIVIFLLLATLAVFTSDNRLAALGVWKAYFIEPILFFIVFINTIKTREDWGLVAWAMGWSALAVALPAIYQKFTGLGIFTLSWFAEETRRVTSWYGYPNALGLYLGPLAMMFSGLFGWRITSQGAWKNWRMWFWAVVVILSLLAIIFAKSEGALFGVLAGVIFWGLFYPNKKTQYSTIVLVILFTLLIAFIPTSRHYVMEKLTFSDLSGQIRVQQWQETWKMLRDGRWLTGAGLAGYQTAIAPYHQEGIWLKDRSDPKWLNKILFNEEYRQAHWQPTEIYLYPHNFFLNFWSEIGLLGLLTVLAILIKFIAGYWSLKNVENRRRYLILLAVMLAILVHGMVDVPYFKNDLSVFFWLVLGLGVLVQKKDIFSDALVI